MTMTMTAVRTLAFALLAMAAGVHAEGKPAPAANVEVGLAKTTNLAPQRWVPGSVVSRDDARIASAEAGRLEFVAEVGTHMKAGERIAKLDDRALRLRREEIQSDVRRTEAQSSLAATQLERLKKLTSTNSIAATQLDDARGLAETNVQNVAHARAQLRQIDHDIDQSDVRAPFSGVVTERFAQRGEYVQTGTAIVHLVDADHVEARVQAPIALAGSIRAGTAVTVKSGDVEQPAKVRAVIPVGDQQSRQFELRVALDGSFAMVGSAVEVALPESNGTATLAVPRDALVQRQDSTYVMRVSADNKAEKVAVTPGASNGELIEVSGLLAAGDRLVVRGAERLTDGQTVAVVGG